MELEQGAVMGKSSKITSERSTQKNNGEKNRRRKTLRWSIKSCFTIFLAFIVTTTTVYSQVLYAQAGETPDSGISFTFQPMNEADLQLTLPEKVPLEEISRQLLEKWPTLPVLLQSGNSDVEVPPKDDTIDDVSGNTPDAGEEGTGSVENPEGSGDSTPNPGEGDTDSGENTEGSGVQTPENTPDAGGEGTDSGENTGGSGVQPPENTSNAGGAGTGPAEDGTTAQTVTVLDPPVGSAPGEIPMGIMTPESNKNSDVSGGTSVDDANTNPSGSGSVDDANTNPSGGDSEDDTNTNPSGGDSVDDANANPPDDTPVDDANANPSDDTLVDNTNTNELTGDPVPSALPVKSWVCAYYHEVRASYTFTPVWDDNLYQHDVSQEYIPKITVIFENIPGIWPVYTEDDLQSAFDSLSADDSGLSIVLMNDIELTRTIEVPDLPDGIKVILESNAGEDGSGGTVCYSLKRGVVADTGEPFTGAMLNFGTPEVMQTARAVAVPLAAGWSRESTLTLRNITIDGKKTAAVTGSASQENQVNAPAVIMNSGHLILGKDASVINNYNIGTAQTDANGQPALAENGANLDACGGGVWVRGGTLELQKDSHISYNCAALSGGGLYLDSGAVLNYYAAETITVNVVFAGGSGADLYACAGSTIYYDSALIDPAVFADKNRFYIDPDAALIPVNPALDTRTPIEIYLNVSENSGYTFRQVKEKLESTFGDRVTVLLPQTYIDTTDLRSWYVYDHYDRNCWDAADADGDRIPDSWEEAYREYLHRPYFVYNSTPTFTVSVGKGNDIPTWLEWLASAQVPMTLAPFKEHIYSRMEDGRPEMTFAGYDQDANVDFLFYNPKSNGQKVVEFDVDSSKVNTHTLEATGFLVNTGIKNSGTDQLLSGYLVYYTYAGSKATQISLVRFEDVNVNSLHNGGGLSVLTAHSQPIGSQTIGTWNSKMSIEITVDSNQVTVKQRPKGSDENDPVAQSFTWPLTGDTGYNGFGPLVAYKSHYCSEASCYTYSNLRMRYSRPDEERDLLSPLMEADFSQQGNVKKYYLNLLGESKDDYNSTDQMGQYKEFLYLMQKEGIGLITDADTPFEQYLGKSGSANLLEIPGLADAGKRTADLNTVIISLQGYLSLYSSTELPAQPESIGLTTPETNVPIGNIWLADASHAQIDRTLDGDRLPKDYYIEVMDISCNHPEGVPIQYSLLKPGSSEFVPIGSGVSSVEGTAAFFTVRGATGVNFVVTHDCRKWPAGEYIVRQQVGDSKIYGYSYFTLTRTVFTEDPEVVPPVEPPIEPPAVEAVSSSGGSAPALAAPEITVPEVTRTTVSSSDGASQPKTGDGMFPAIPVACGACTAFMLKIMLWMYDVDFDVITECKEEMVRSLILWGKGSTKPRIYLAIAALAAVITAYHLLRAFVANSKQIVRERLGI